MPIVPHSTRLHTIFIGPLQVVDAMQRRLRLREGVGDGHQRQRFRRAVEVIRQFRDVLARDARVYGGHKTRLAPSRMPEVHYSGRVALSDGRPRLLELPELPSDLVPVYARIFPTNAALLPHSGLYFNTLIQIFIVLVELSYLGYGR